MSALTQAIEDLKLAHDAFQEALKAEGPRLALLVEEIEQHRAAVMEHAAALYPKMESVLTLGRGVESAASTFGVELPPEIRAQFHAAANIAQSLRMNPITANMSASAAGAAVADGMALAGADREPGAPLIDPATGLPVAQQ